MQLTQDETKDWRFSFYRQKIKALRQQIHEECETASRRRFPGIDFNGRPTIEEVAAAMFVSDWLKARGIVEVTREKARELNDRVLKGLLGEEDEFE